MQKPVAQSLMRVNENASHLDFKVASGAWISDRSDLDLIAKPLLDKGLGSIVPRPIPSPSTPLDRHFE
jgi:hypothetical protein